MSLREEMIQVAAVAVSIIEDLDKGVADWSDEKSWRILEDVSNERIRQDEKWGPQHHNPGIWLAILLEEVGEVAEEIDPWAIEVGGVQGPTDVSLRQHYLDDPSHPGWGFRRVVYSVREIGNRARRLLERIDAA